MTRQLSVLIVSTLILFRCAVQAEEPTPGKAVQPESNQVYVKVIMPTDPADREKNRFIVESWIAEDLKKLGQNRFSAVTGWVLLDRAPLGATDVWHGGELDNIHYCPVGADIPDQAWGRIKIIVGGWSPGGAFATAALADEPGSRAIAAVKECQTENGMPYVAFLICPPPETPPLRRTASSGFRFPAADPNIGSAAAAGRVDSEKSVVGRGPANRIAAVTALFPAPTRTPPAPHTDRFCHGMGEGDTGSSVSPRECELFVTCGVSEGLPGRPPRLRR